MERVGISPFEIRYRNAIRPEQALPNGQIANPSTALVETLDAVRPYYDANPKMGIACAMKNSGLGVGVPDTGRVTLHVEKGQVPPIRSILMEKSQSELVYGAKGIGEICSIPTPHAVQGSYCRFDGVFRTSLPLEKYSVQP